MKAQQFLGLRATHNPHRWVLPVDPSICVRVGFLFGGCGLAASVTALEETSGRPLVWATAQYLDYARPPAIVDLDVTLPVRGKQTTQARAMGRVLDQEIFTVNAALGERPLDLVHQWGNMPQVPPPGDCPPVPQMPVPGEIAGAIDSRVELRVARGRYGAERDGTPSVDGRSALWARMSDDVELSAAKLAIIADWVPSGIGQALGRWAGGNSLDNTIRILRLVPTEWVLCDIRVFGVARGFGHGEMLLWSEDGTLLATASQSLIVRVFDEGRFPNREPGHSGSSQPRNG